VPFSWALIVLWFVLARAQIANYREQSEPPYCRKGDYESERKETAPIYHTPSGWEKLSHQPEPLCRETSKVYLMFLSLRLRTYRSHLHTHGRLQEKPTNLF
jgi:hypothetical protein